MFETLTHIHPFVIFLGIGGGMALSLFVYRSVQSRRWQRFARRNGLDFVPGSFFASPRIQGRYRGIDVIFYVEMRSSGRRNNTRYTVADALLRYPPSLGLKVYREGLLSKVGKAVGMQDIQVGDAAFDKKVMVKGNSEEAVRRYLRPELRQALLQMIDSHRGSFYDDRGAHYERVGWLADPHKLKSLLDSMVACCLVGDKVGAKMSADRD